jgi:hypothetical protein
MSTDTNYSPDDSRYWAAEEPNAIAAAVVAQFRKYQARCASDGRLDIWRTSDRCYHGRNPDGGYSNAHAVTFGGTQGEVAQLHVGHYRQIIASQLTIATEQRPAVECTATSNDPEAISDTIVGRQVLEYDLDEGGLEQDIHATHERALVYSEGYLVQVWDHNAGELVGTRMLPPESVDASSEGIPGTEDEAGAMMAQIEGVDVPVREGMIRVEVRSPINVARDLDRDEITDFPWYIVRSRRHRWELAARYPEDAEKRDAILSAPSVGMDDFALEASTSGGESDYVHLFTLYHPPSDALPQGRLVEVVNETRISPIQDAYPFDHQVVHADVPSAELEKSVGYGDAWDMLAPTQALDSVESGMLSVADAGALIRWSARRGAKVDARQLDTGMTLHEHDDEGNPNAKGPELMERPEVRPSDLNYAQHHRQNLETLSGINATIRGTADSQAKSGADRALIATMAVRANSKHQRALASLTRSVLNGRVKLYKAFCSEERLVEIAGRDKSGHVASFSSKTFDSVRRVRVEIGPADLRTVEGKIALADKMVEMFGPEMITPSKYMALRTLGRADEIDDDVAGHKSVARRENDTFRKGEPVQCMVHHHHEIHLAEHVRDVTNAEIVGDPNRVPEIQMRLAHIMEHQAQWVGCPPEILQATGQRPAPSSLMGPGAPPPGGPPMGPPPPMPPGGPQPPQGPPPGMPPLEVGQGGPGLPSMPVVPGTGGERFSPGQMPPGMAQ